MTTRLRVLASIAACLTAAPMTSAKEGVIQCANLIYASDKTSKCFSDEFLRRIESKTTIRTERTFKAVKLGSDELYSFPFTIMTGEGRFLLAQGERDRLKDYLNRGGFLLASAGCSSKEWDESFRREVKRIFPDRQLISIPMSHAIFRTVFKVEKIKLKGATAGQTDLSGLEIGGKIVMVYSPQGLNDTEHTSGCCCCGGNEILNSLEINVNVLAYALLQ